MARKVTAMQNSKGSVKDLMFLNSLMNLDDLIELSNVSRAVQPQVHVAASNSFELDFVPNSDEQMILVQNDNDAYLAVNNTQQTQQYFYRLSSSVATTFNNIYSSNVDGISALLSSDTQLTKESSFAELKPDEKFIAKAYWPEDQYIDLNGADGIYYWELFFYVPLLLAKSFANNYEHEKAKKWFEYVFNPANSSNASAGNIDANDKFWNFIGMQSSRNNTLRYEHFSNANFETLSELEDGKLQPKWDTHLAAITKYHNDPFDPHAIAKLRPIAYQKWVFRAYVDNLINWGDDLYRENTRETLQEAFMFYQVVSNLLGDRPISVGEARQSSVKNLFQLTRLSASLNSFLLGLENSLSFTGALNSSPVTTPHNDIVNAYFKVPENISFIKIWDTVAERLCNLRHQLTIDGEPNNLPLFQPPADPMKMIAAVNSGSMNFTSAAGELTKLPPYRFSKVFSLANQFASVLYRFEIKLSGAIAQKAGHTLQELRASHMANIQRMMLDNRVNMVKIAQSRLDTMKLSLERTKYKKDYYDTMLNYGIGKKSKDLKRYSAALGLKDVSLVFTQLAANFMEASAVCSFMKMVGAPLSGLIVGMACGGANLSGVPEGAAHAATQQAFAFQTEAAVFERIAAQLERAQNYFFMKKESEEQIKILNKRIKAAELSVQNAKNQLQVQKEQIKFYNKMDEYYKERFLNEELYTWMVQEMTTIYKQGYNMAYDIAMQAQAAYQYEILDESASFITNSWDDSRKGFLAAEAIQNDLMRMEKAYYEKNVRDFEIVKEVSLAETDAVALMQLMETGKCDFSLRESLFNADYPGHYQRRIKSVSISILSSLKPTRINATLTQVSNKILTEPNADLVSYVDTGKNAKGKDSLTEDVLAKLKLNF